MLNDVGPALDEASLRRRMEDLVSMVMSVRRSVAGAARELASLTRGQQERFLAAVALISQETVELAYNFCVFGVPAGQILSEEEWPAWVRHILETYDQGGVLASIVALQQVDDYKAQLQRHCASSVSFDEVHNVLTSFLTGLDGRSLRLQSAECAYTDTATIYLPPHVGQASSRAANFLLYKALAVHQWAQTWFGTWRADIGRITAAYEDPERALACLHRLEVLRLDACIARELPGLYRAMQQLQTTRAQPSWPATWRDAERLLTGSHASVFDSVACLASVYREPGMPAELIYQGVLRPEETEAVVAARLARERKALQRALRSAAHDLLQRKRLLPASATRPWRISLGGLKGQSLDTITLSINGEAAPVSADLRELLSSIVQDVGQIPPEYLEAAGSGAYDSEYRTVGPDGVQAPRTGTYLYDEWDHMRQTYRKDWCVLKARSVRERRDGFAHDTLCKYRGLLKNLYKTFEALRGEDKRLRKEPFGDDIDLDAVVESYADARAGREWSERSFIKRKRYERNIAVVFLADMSGSTKGWINDLEREALILLCQCLEILGDRYAIYGFSGFTHRRCELMEIKTFSQAYDDVVRARISGMRPQDYTRMGVFIRHLTKVFQDIDARTKLLVTLSDGRPDDQDGYRGAYGIEDTRKALFEARHQGVHPYCITIDKEGLEYLPHMYGRGNFSVISDVAKLPYKVSDIYKRITG